MPSRDEKPLRVFIGCPGDLAPDRAPLMELMKFEPSFHAPVKSKTWTTTAPSIGHPQRVISAALVATAHDDWRQPRVILTSRPKTLGEPELRTAVAAAPRGRTGNKGRRKAGISQVPAAKRRARAAIGGSKAETLKDGASIPGACGEKLEKEMNTFTTRSV